MKQLLFLVISIFLVGCGDGEDRVSSSDTESSANMIVPLEVGETRTFALNMNVGQSYLVTAETVGTDKKVAYEIDYQNKLYPEIVVTGVSEGVEDFTVSAEDASGYRQTALIRASVYEGEGDINGTAVDIADGESGGSGTDSNGSNNGGGDNGGTTPPDVTPSQDPNACLDSWGTVSDSWATVEGTFSTDLHYWIRSQVSVEPSQVTLYYKKVLLTTLENYTALGEYNYTNKDGKILRFDLQVLTALLGSNNPYFYVKFREDCYRGNLPATPLMPPDKTLTPVFTGTTF